MPLIRAALSYGRLVIVAAVAAVASTPAPAGAQGNTTFARPIGLYHFQERIHIGGASPAIMLEGDFNVLTDTLLLNATPGPCRYDMRTTGAGRMLFQCADISLSFDRRDPLRHPEYSVSAVVSMLVRTCSQLRADGTCARYVSEQVERTVTRSGILHPAKVPAGRP